MSTKSTTTKSTKADRLAQLREQGLSNIEAEIQIAQEDAEAKIAALKVRQAREEKKIRETMLDLLESEHKDQFDALRAKAVKKREQDAKARSNRTRSARAQEAPAQGQPGLGQSNEYRDGAQ